VIRQTAAILLDAYRELNARKMFWIVMLLSALSIGAFALVGVGDKTIKIANLSLPEMGIPPLLLYKQLFRSLIIGMWLTWAATILALISTSSIFPDLMAGGSIDLFLSKPISRLRLFLTKYFAGLLFVLLQVLVFCIISILVLRIRGGFWMPTIFWAIPIVVCFFSYLFAVCVLVGVITRSALAALLLTMLFWLLCFSVGTAEVILLQWKTGVEQEAAMRGETGGQKVNAPRMWHSIAFAVKTLVPKTGETIGLLDRWLITENDLKDLQRMAQAKDSDMRAERNVRSRPVSWVVGTSLVFEGVILSLAAFIFCRRDY
jgi:hypothetical protein